MTPLQIDIVETGQGIIIRLSGDGGTVAVDALQRPLSGIQARRPALVVFDLAELFTVASLFMGALVTFRRALVRNAVDEDISQQPTTSLDQFGQSFSQTTQRHGLGAVRRRGDGASVR